MTTPAFSDYGLLVVPHIVFDEADYEAPQPIAPHPRPMSVLESTERRRDALALRLAAVAAEGTRPDVLRMLLTAIDGVNAEIRAMIGVVAS